MELYNSKIERVKSINKFVESDILSSKIKTVKNDKELNTNLLKK
jgi:hypothetical protein